MKSTTFNGYIIGSHRGAKQDLIASNTINSNNVNIPVEYYVSEFSHDCMIVSTIIV